MDTTGNVVRRYVRDHIQKRATNQQYVRAGLVNDGKPFAPGQLFLERFADRLLETFFLLFGHFVGPSP